MKSETLKKLSEDILINHFLCVSDVKKSSDFYQTIFKCEVLMEGEPTLLKTANTWILLNVGGGPTEDKPETILSPPKDIKNVSSFINLVVSDVQKCYKEWSLAGVEFLTEPKENPYGWRCYVKDPDGYIIEVMQFNKDVIASLNLK